MDPGTIGMVMGVWTLFFSAVHDHMHSKGERKTTFFKWTGTNYSPLVHMAEILRKGDAKPKARQKR